jgi:hypothetical protein
LVFVDQSSESVVALDRAGGASWRRAGCLEAASAVRLLVVVVLEVLVEDSAEVALVADQEPVEALCSDGADEALGVGVRDGRVGRRLDDPDPFAREDGVDDERELAVAITDSADAS